MIKVDKKYGALVKKYIVDYSFKPLFGTEWKRFLN